MNPVALITGASRGIGRGIAMELAKVGYDLVINYAQNESAAELSARQCEAAAEQTGCRVRTAICQADISSAPDRSRLVSFVREQFQRLDLLVNNAGVAPAVRADLLEGTEESFDRLIRINVKGPYFLTQLVARWWTEPEELARSSAPGAPGSRKIVTISSISADTASVTRGDYCMAKAALSMLTPLYATRLAQYGINVYEIRPGIIGTDMTEPVKERYDRLIKGGLTPIPRWGTPEDVGKAVVAVAMDWLPFSTGQVLNVDGGFHVRRL
jgi:3-oxoacyl-[acyl-carrier protein] reductase